jgi:uncharacterized SAM-binding protein YcdF (DUF218 family)/glycosyltransferase involved in cell wall biosynthesis
MLTDRDIVCISSIDWDFIWQGHQEIMATFAREGNRVLFIENTGVRRPTMRDASRVRQRLRNWWRGFKGFREERPNLFVYSPLVLPGPYSRVVRWINAWLLGRIIRRWMQAVGFTRPIAWTFLPTPLARDLIKAVDPQLVVYYCIDDFASSSAAARRISQSENALFQQADLVFVTSEKLRERAARHSPRVHVFPFAVSYAAFEEVRVASDSIPDDIRSLRRPIAGYVGGVHKWVDQELLVAAAAARPDLTFALIGPAQTDVSALEGCSNVHLLGKRPHAEVPSYIKGFDVALVPYTLSDYTASVYPTKVNEYLAMGVPVVSTDLPEIRRFNADHGDIVAIARDAGALVRAIDEAAGERSEAAVTRRLEVAKANSWARRIEGMSDLIESALDARQVTDRSWQQRLRRVYTIRRRLAAVGMAIALGILLMFYTPFLWWFAEPLRMAQTPAPAPADAVVVFAGGVGESGLAGGGYQERVKHALDLHREGLAPSLLFSSGYVFAFREAEVMRDLALANGVAASDVVLETAASNTYENVLYSRDIARRRGWRRVLLVSSPYHMARAVRTWRTVAPDIEVIPAPVPRSQFYTHGIGASLDQVRGIAHEYVALIYYRWKGWL